MPRKAIAFLAALPLFSQTGESVSSKTTLALGSKFAQAHEYAFEGEMQIHAQRGAQPGRLLAQAKVSFASAPGGKSFVRIESLGKDAYTLVSDGQTSWAWVPKLKQYTEEEAAALDQDQEQHQGASDEERDLSEKFGRLIVPSLARLHTTAQAADFHGDAEIRFEKKKQRWPLLRVLSKPESDGSRNLYQIVLRPETLDIARLVWSYTTIDGQQKMILQTTVDFTSFQLGPLPASTFAFDPPKNAKLVDALPIPGQTGSFLLNRTAPDFEAKTLDGEKVHLSDLRGKPVLLCFWASWCGPCRRELPELAALHDQFRRKGLVILGVNDEDRATARKFSEKALLPFATIDDSSRKAHRLFRVNAIPSTFLIDKDGTIVRFMRGAREPAALRAALSAVGL